MARESVYCKDNKWFKGNLHSHTTRSDGRLSPPEVAEIHRTRGWNFWLSQTTTSTLLGRTQYR